MGVILSAFLCGKNEIKKSQDKKTAKNNPPEVATRATASQPFAPSQTHEAAQGLTDEHLSSTPPPTIGSQQGAGLGQVERKIALEAPLPIAATSTNTNPFSTEPTTRGERVENQDTDRMASDEDYASFLDKANEDPNKGVAKTQSSGKIQLKAVDPGVKVPAGLKEATKDSFYVSDADEPFEPVVLKHPGKSLPDEETFAKLVNHPNPKDADVSIIDIGEWDQQGQYKAVVDAVRKETKGSDVRVYRITRDGTRVEYFVVGLAGGKLVGVKALAIES